VGGIAKSARNLLQVRILLLEAAEDTCCCSKAAEPAETAAKYSPITGLNAIEMCHRKETIYYDAYELT
jgi:hypothetical protein